MLKHNATIEKFLSGYIFERKRVPACYFVSKHF